MTDVNPLKKFLNKFEDALIENKCKTLYGKNISSMPPSRIDNFKRIIVIGDIHGDFDKLIQCLKIGKLINDKQEWIGKDTYVVQVGDQIDSCRPTTISCHLEKNVEDKAEDILILEFLTNLHRQAEKAKGGVFSLVGNHELMNVEGDMTYVSRKNLLDERFSKSPSNIGIMEPRINAFKPGNKYANFLGCTRPMSIIIGDNLFVHAGIVPEIAKKYEIEDMNKLLQLYLLGFLDDSYSKEEKKIFNEIFNSPNNSPLWNRIFGNSKKLKQSECKKYMDPLRNFYKVGKIYVGHTPQMNDGITSTCDNTIWLTDVGLSRVFNQFDGGYSPVDGDSSVSEGRKAQILEITKKNGKDIFRILK